MFSLPKSDMAKVRCMSDIANKKIKDANCEIHYHLTYYPVIYKVLNLCCFHNKPVTSSCF
jgi:hypothetical protein